MEDTAMPPSGNVFASRASSAISAAALAVAVSGCAVGPDFQRPEPPAASRYTETPLPHETASSPVMGGAAQRFAAGDLPAQWWSLFQSDALDRLVREALAGSPTIAAAQATLRQSQETLTARTGALLYPNVNASFTGARQNAAITTGFAPSAGSAVGVAGFAGPAFDLYNASVAVSYKLDAFGGSRRELESLQSLVNYQQFQLAGAHLTLTANVVTAAIREAALRAQLQATRDTLAAEQESVDRVRRKYELGGSGRLDLVAVQSQAAQTEALIPPLESALAQVRNQLAVLTGRSPSEATIPQFELQALQLPQDIPLRVPSELVRQRPDILASEALLHEASAQVGVATANLYPQITLSASLSGVSTDLHNVLSGPALWSIGGSLLQPIFHGGELQAQRRAAIAAYDAALSQYQETVLQAFRNVADALHALEADARTVKAQADAEALARARLDLTRRQWELGGTSYLALLDAQRDHAQARALLVSVQGSRYADTAALFQAMGGGWWAPDGSAAAQGHNSMD